MPDYNTGYSAKENTITSNKVIKFKKRRKSGKLFILILLLVLVLLTIMFTPLFNIKYIEVKGNEKFTKEYIIDSSGILLGQNIFKINYVKSKNNILYNSYISQAKITRKYPNTLEINIIERKPSAALALMGSYLLLDSSGIVLDVTNSLTELKVVSVNGIRFSEYMLGGKLEVNNEDKLKFETLLECLGGIEKEQLHNTINMIDISDPNRITAWALNNKYQINLSDSQKIPYKFKMLKEEILPDLEKSKSPKGIIDFTIAYKPTFKPKD